MGQGSQLLRFSEFSPEFGGLVQNLPIFLRNSGDFLVADILRFLRRCDTTKLDCWFKSYSFLNFNLQNYEKMFKLLRLLFNYVKILLSSTSKVQYRSAPNN